jgi:DNA invertase Pin-like site-specific DNA recombinase
MSKREKIPQPREGKVAAIYCRKSDLKEETKGKSVEQQLEQCKTAAKAMGYQVDERHIYLEIDGAKGYFHFQDNEGRNPPPYRKELTLMMEAVDNDEIDVCLVWRTDRLYRDEIVGALILRKLRSKGVALYAKTLNYHIHEVAGFDNAMQDAIRNRSYSDRISSDVYRNHETKAKAGEIYKDPSCLGFRSAGLRTCKAVPIQEELDIVRKVFELYCYGPEGGAPMSASGIADHFMDIGIKVAVGAKNHKCRDDSVVHGNQVAQILKNPSYIGMQQFDGKLYPCDEFLVDALDGSKAAVISRDQFDMAAQMKEEAGKNLRLKEPTLLRGLTVCPSCGRKTYAHPKGFKFERSIYCMNRIGRYKTCFASNYRSLHMADLEQWVKIHLADLLIAELQAMRAERSGQGVQRELNSVERKIEELRRTETTRLTELSMGALDPSQIATVAAEFRRQKAELQKRADDLRRNIRGHANGDRSDPFELQSANDAALRTALQRSIRWIAITKWGLVVLTKGGSYIGARLGPGKKRERGGHKPPTILPPDVEATKECLKWIGDRERFLVGLRRGVGVAHAPSDPDDLLCPEYPELEMIYEVSDAA